MSRNKLSATSRFFDTFFSKYMIIFLGLKKSIEPKFVLNQGYRPRERKKFLARFSQITDNDGHRVTIC